MKRLFLFCFLGSLAVTGQPINIELKNFPIEIEDRNYFIKGVIDGRKDTSKIGWSTLNKETQGRTYRFKGGLEGQLTKYFENNLKKDSGQTPLYLNVISLIIMERANIMREGKAYTVVEFYKKQDNLYGKIFETSFKTESTSEFAKDIYSTNERRIRFLFTNCLKNLSLSKWAEIKPDFVTLEELKEESQLKDTLSKFIKDSIALFKSKKQQQYEALQLSQLTYKSGFLPSYLIEEKTYRTLWPLKSRFLKLGNKGVNSSFVDYKAKLRLTFFTLGIGAALVGLSFIGEDVQESGFPNLALLVPGAVFMGFSVPVYLKSRKLGRATVDKYNVALESK